MTVSSTDHIMKAASVSLVLLWAGPSLAHDKDGGLLIYAEQGGEYVVLLADHGGTNEPNKWAGLGGTFDSKWDETALDAAVRETSEETFCFYSEAAFLTDPTSLPPIRENHFVTYLVEVPFVPPEKIENRERRGSFCIDGHDTRERMRFRWVKWSDLKQDLIRLEQDGKVWAGGSKSSKKLNATLAELPGQENYYRDFYVRTLHKFLQGQYPGW